MGWSVRALPMVGKRRETPLLSNVRSIRTAGTPLKPHVPHSVKSRSARPHPGNFVASPIVEFFVVRGLSCAASPVRFPTCRRLRDSSDPRGPKRMAADPHARPEIGGAALDHAPARQAVHRFFRQPVRREQGRPFRSEQPGCVHGGGKRVGIGGASP